MKKLAAFSFLAATVISFLRIRPSDSVERDGTGLLAQEENISQKVAREYNVPFVDIAGSE